MVKKEVEGEKPVKTSEDRYVLTEVPTQTGIFIKDNKSEEVIEDKSALVQILNKLEKIEKAVC